MINFKKNINSGHQGIPWQIKKDRDTNPCLSNRYPLIKIFLLIKNLALMNKGEISPGVFKDRADFHHGFLFAVIDQQ